MTNERFQAITGKYPSLKIALVGDFCLDRYLEIDPKRAETSIETGLPVHNVVGVRAQPGGTGTILNNLVALGIGTIYPVGFCGEDGEGFELHRAIAALPGVSARHFLRTRDRRTFTYCKPLVCDTGQPPRELNRLDSKNWTPTPSQVEDHLIAAVRGLAPDVDAMILLDQVDVPDTGVVTNRLLECIGDVIKSRPELLVLADSRQGLSRFPPVIFKMNAAELATLTGTAPTANIEAITQSALALVCRNGRPAFVTLSERGMMGVASDGATAHIPSLPLRGPIDIVGAGDAVTANLTVALAAGATVPEALEAANVAASVVVHQLGTTGTASREQLRELLCGK